MTHDLKWLDAPPGEVLDPVGIWIVRAPPASPPAADGHTPDWLDEKERSRLAAIPQPAGKSAYLFAHWALRSVLGSSLGCPATSVGFERRPCPGCGGAHGRPALRDVGPGAPAPEFSMSHSGDHVAIAVAEATIGIDIESWPTPQAVAGYLPFLHPREQQWLKDRPEGELVRDFARLWTRKEAMAKATGAGMAAVMNRMDLTGQPLGWRVRQLLAPPGYEASFAVPASVHVEVTLHDELPEPMPAPEPRRVPEAGRVREPVRV
ncbi:4'-phosphopantetheinyl transferase family protein [Streptomyces sp. NPDC058657]|uniref:4'-phosphopantetheinyl transferase family protein n=1 Tax=unclassified Streptomyces TaxID=2593676 RepID=UPI0036629332